MLSEKGPPVSAKWPVPLPEDGALRSAAGAGNDADEESRAGRGDDEDPAPHCRSFTPGTNFSDVISDTDRQPARPIVRSKSAMKFAITSRTPASPAIASP